MSMSYFMKAKLFVVALTTSYTLNQVDNLGRSQDINTQLLLALKGVLDEYPRAVQVAEYNEIWCQFISAQAQAIPTYWYWPPRRPLFIHQSLEGLAEDMDIMGVLGHLGGVSDSDIIATGLLIDPHHLEALRITLGIVHEQIVASSENMTQPPVVTTPEFIRLTEDMIQASGLNQHPRGVRHIVWSLDLPSMILRVPSGTIGYSPLGIGRPLHLVNPNWIDFIINNHNPAPCGGEF